jgi:hypothetical protein
MAWLPLDDDSKPRPAARAVVRAALEAALRTMEGTR